VDNYNQWVLLHRVVAGQSTHDSRGFEKHVRAEDNRMGFEDYKLDFVFSHRGGKHFIHKEDIDQFLQKEEVVVELEDYVPQRTVGFSRRDVPWIGRRRFIFSIRLMMGPSLRLAPNMRFPSKHTFPSRRRLFPPSKRFPSK